MAQNLSVPGYLVQDKPRVYSSIIPGKWLLSNTFAAWRKKSPHKGFQRIVDEGRCRKIAENVLEQKRTFPNSIILATNVKVFALADGNISIPPKTRLLVVDGQHRLWAQKYSQWEAQYACILHCGLDEVAMANLFLEINNTQKRVPPSLRWDLLRLIRPSDDIFGSVAADIVHELTTDEDGPMFQRIDLTGENKRVAIKQAGIAPEIRSIVSSKSLGLREMNMTEHLRLFSAFFSSIRAVAADDWGSDNYPLSMARVMRAVLRLLPEIVRKSGRRPRDIGAADFHRFLRRIRVTELSTEKIRAKQGNAGIADICKVVREQVFGSD